VSGKRILHVEDTWECHELVRAILTFHGYEVLHAEDGGNGVTLAQETCPDLVLMDIHLPRIDGLEATRQIRSTPGLESLPIIALTAADDDDDYQRAMAAGCNAYLSKPFSLSELVTLVSQYCERTPAHA
jgi:two-component system cell cycle response regulator DivK